MSGYEKTVVFMKVPPSGNTITIADVRASQNLSAASIPLLMRYVFVPAAWPLTVVAVRVGLSPNQTTLIRAVAGLTAMFLISQGSSALLYAGCLFLLIVLVGDSVDGNLCRLQDRASYFGKFFDGLVDMAIDLMFPFALAIHLWRTDAAGPTIFVYTGFGILALAFVFLVIQRSSFFNILVLQQAGQGAVEGSKQRHPGLLRFLNLSRAGNALAYFGAYGMNLVFDLRYLGFILALLTGGLTGYLYALDALYVAGFFFLCVGRVARAYVEIDVHRRSRSAR